MRNIICFANQKGGVGKSTTAFNVGHLLAEDGYKVLMIDFDPQSSLTAIFNKENTKYCMYEVCRMEVSAKDATIHITENLDLLPAGQRLSNLELEIVKEKGRELFLKRITDQLKNSYDYIIIDCLPSLNLLLVNSLAAATDVIIPCQTDFLAYKGLDLLLNTIASVKTHINPGINILGVVATFYNGRTRHNREVLELLEELDINVITTIGSSVKVKDATVASEPLHHFDKSSKIVEEYKLIKEKIING